MPLPENLIEKEKLAEIEKDMLLMLVAHHMKPELRRVLMETLPAAYNKWMGAKIMASVTVSSEYDDYCASQR